MVIKLNEELEKTGNVENNDEFKKYILRGKRITRYLNQSLSESRGNNEK